MVDAQELRNTYHVLRHGHSVANQLRLIVSSPAVGLEAYGLSDRGADEVRASIRAKAAGLAGIRRIYCSDFLRTRQSAEIAAESIQAPVECSWRLRERGFGDWEGSGSDHYQQVWERDAADDSHRDWNVESVRDVARRLMGLLREIESAGSGQAYLLVSHGDPLQILLTAVSGADLRSHRRLDPLRTAELRSFEPGARLLRMSLFDEGLDL
jgi:probable phosphoglycerate mutase